MSRSQKPHDNWWPLIVAAGVFLLALVMFLSQLNAEIADRARPVLTPIRFSLTPTVPAFGQAQVIAYGEVYLEPSVRKLIPPVMCDVVAGDTVEVRQKWLGNGRGVWYLIRHGPVCMGWVRGGILVDVPADVEIVYLE